MSEVAELEIAVGDQVRVHFHPPGWMRSFCEGMVSRVDVITPEGRFFAVEVTREVILDRKHNISGFEDYVRYECRNDFPGRIEILPTATQEVEREPALDPISVKPMVESEQEANEQHQVELEVHSEPEIVQAPETEAEANVEPLQVDVESQPARKPRGLIGALFGRKR